MLGFNGGLIGVSRGVSASNGSGIWLPNEQAEARRQGAWPTGNDPFAASVALLLRLDGAVGDLMPVNLGLAAAALSTTGSPQVVDTQLLFGGNATRFGPSGRYVTAVLPGGLGANDFTIEFWAYPLSPSSPGGTFNSRGNGGNNGDGVDVFFDWRLTTANQSLINLSAELAASRWYHVAYVRRNGVFARFIDGIGVSGSTNTNNMNSSTLYIGASPVGNISWFNGFMREFRLTLAARYSANFTPPSEPFPLPGN